MNLNWIGASMGLVLAGVGVLLILGASIGLVLAGVGVFLVLAGIGFLLLGRRKRTKFEA